MLRDRVVVKKLDIFDLGCLRCIYCIDWVFRY